VGVKILNRGWTQMNADGWKTQFSSLPLKLICAHLRLSAVEKSLLTGDIRMAADRSWTPAEKDQAECVFDKRHHRPVGSIFISEN
jgi:hypothetical protein